MMPKKEKCRVSLAVMRIQENRDIQVFENMLGIIERLLDLGPSKSTYDVKQRKEFAK
jgi:hypothetical protein